MDTQHGQKGYQRIHSFINLGEHGSLSAEICKGASMIEKAAVSVQYMEDAQSRQQVMKLLLV